MAKELKQEELELDDKKNAKSTGGNEEVVVVNDEDKAKAETPPDVEKTIKDLQDRMAKSDEARKLAEDKATRLEKERAEANAKAERAEGKAASSQKEAIVQALAASEEALVVHRGALKAALIEGDSDKVVELQEKLAETKYLNSELKKNKIGFEQWERQQEEQAKQQKEVTLPPTVQDWIEKNPRYKSDSDFKAEADVAHDVAIRRGYGFGSSAYLNFIDGRLKQIFPEKVENVNNEDDVETPKKKEQSYSAPPSRGSSSNNDRDTDYNGKKVYKLSAEQREAAEFMNMTDIQYAQYLEAEKKRK